LNAAPVSFATPGLTRSGVLLSVLFLLLAGAVRADDCKPQGRLEPVRVERAVDGDTLVLTDGRRVRLIGFNSPEKANKGRPAEPLASAAQTALANLLVGKTAYLEAGQEPRDRYGRTLAHAYLTPQGDSVEAMMLRQGWGFQVIIAPNKAHADCFARAEREARQARRGVWANTYYKALHAAQVDGSRLGFVHVQGNVQKAAMTKAALWLSLEGEVVLRINRQDLALRGWPVGDANNIAQWQGKSVTVRGWLTDRYAGKSAPKNRQRYVMNLSHPAMIE
jgi:endonuclease YncB( thermonuclease family)